MRFDPGLTSVLNERARRLALPLPTDSVAAVSTGLLRFRVGGEAIACATDAIVEVQAVSTPAPLPGMPKWLAGMIGVHGRIMPAIWLDRLLADRSGSDFADPAQRVIVVQDAGAVIGLLATAVEGIASAAESEPGPLPVGISAVALDCGTGMDNGHLIIDVARLFRVVSAALGSSPADEHPSPLIETTQGEQSHAPRT